MPRIQARIGAERPSERPSATRSTFDFFFCHPHSSSRFSPIPSHTLSTRPPAQDNREQITFLPTLTAPDLPFSFLFVFSLSLYFRQRQSTLSHSSTAPVRPRTFLNRFLFIFADISLTTFLYIRHNDDAFTYSSPTPLLLPPDSITNCRDSNVFKQASSLRTALEHLLLDINLSVCLFSLLFYSLVCVPTIPSTRHLRSWNCRPHRASSRISTLLSPLSLYLGRHTHLPASI